MKVILLHHTPLWIADKAIGKCWDKVCRLKIEHLFYNFDIDGISKVCLQKLARHRMASLSVKNIEYTLKELKDDNSDNFEDKYIVLTGDIGVDNSSRIAISNLQHQLQRGISNDIAKYCLPETYKTSLVWSISARSLQNFLQLRTSKSALWEIRDFANAIYKVLPEDHKFLFKDYIK